VIRHVWIFAQKHASLIYFSNVDFFYIGYITKTHGLKGEVQLFFEFEDYRELDFDVVFLETDKKKVPYFVTELKILPNGTARLALEDVDHVDKARPLLRKKAFLPKDRLPVRDPDEFRYADLVGYLAIDEREGELGRIANVREMPQQHIAAVDFGGRELLFPLNGDFIRDIDPEGKTIEVDLPDGLMDVYRG